MRIKNVTSGNIQINDLPSGQAGSALHIPPDAEVLIYNEDAERSKQLGSFLTSGAIVNLGPEEPNSGDPEADTQPVILGSYQVMVQNLPVAGKALVATSQTTAEWQSTGGTITFIDGEVPMGVINGTNTIFTLANIPAPGSLHLFKNGLRQRPTVDYTIVAQTITFVTAPDALANLLSDYRL